MTILQTWRWVAATATLDKWYLAAQLPSNHSPLGSRCAGLVWHDRYLCGDADRGRKWDGRNVVN